MKKNIRFMLTILLSIMVLAACNTAEQPLSEPENDSTTTNNKNDNVEAEDQVNETEEQQKETTSTPDGDSNSITFTSKNKEYTEETSPISGETYSIQAIPGFSLTPEEPGKDMLYYETDDSISMRIEAISENDSFDNLVANTEETMTAIDKQYESFDLAPYTSETNLESSTAYIAHFENEEVIAIVFEKNDKLVRLTIYDNQDYDLSDAMIKMGLTIE